MSENVCVQFFFFDNGKMYNLIVRPHNGIYIYFFSMINQFQEWYKREKKEGFFYESCDNGFAINLQQIELNV